MGPVPYPGVPQGLQEPLHMPPPPPYPSSQFGAFDTPALTNLHGDWIDKPAGYLLQ